MVLNWFKKRNSPPEQQFIMLTELWNAAHPHLTPLKKRLDLPHGSLSSCDCCGDASSIRIRANLNIENAHWIENASIKYCYACDNYYISTVEYQEHLNKWNLARQPQSVASQANPIITGIDARLWASKPVVLNIEPTTRCNFNCWYCIGRSMVQADIDFDGFVSAINNFPTLQIVAIVGEGEPLLHKQFFDMVKVCKDRGLRVVTVSNGSPFSESVVKKLCESGVDYIAVSIDSIDPKTFAESRIDGDLEKVWSNIKRLADYKAANGFRYPMIGLKGTLFDHTQNELPAITREAKKHGVDMFEAFQSLNPKKTYVSIYPEDKVHLLKNAPSISKRMSEEFEKSALPSVAEFAIQEGMAIRNDGGPNGIRPNCNEEWIYSLLSGDVTPCCQIKSPIDENWNLFKFPISEILNNQHYQNVRFNLWNGIFLTDCEGCTKTRSI